jgi:hypothetical protein
MTPRITSESLVGARHAVPVLSERVSAVPPGRSAPPPPGPLNRSVFSRLFFPVALAQLSTGRELSQLASEASASASTNAPRAISSGEANSSGRWLYPLKQGTNSIATGAMRDIKSES